MIPDIRSGRPIALQICRRESRVRLRIDDLLNDIMHERVADPVIFRLVFRIASGEPQ